MKTSSAPVHTATDLDHALALRRDHPEATVLAGGTDLMVFIETGAISPETVINIWGCSGLLPGQLRGGQDDTGKHKAPPQRHSCGDPRPERMLSAICTRVSSSLAVIVVI